MGSVRRAGRGGRFGEEESKAEETKRGTREREEVKEEEGGDYLEW